MVQNRQLIQLMGLDLYDGAWPDGHAVALRDFNPDEVRAEFEAKYRGRGDEFSYHFKAYLLKRRYIILTPPESIATVYL